ncbi:hypothetical protein BpHYR1_007714, partial [Brachionus plicatilis]
MNFTAPYALQSSKKTSPGKLSKTHRISSSFMETIKASMAAHLNLNFQNFVPSHNFIKAITKSKFVNFKWDSASSR